MSSRFKPASAEPMANVVVSSSSSEQLVQHFIEYCLIMATLSQSDDKQHAPHVFILSIFGWTFNTCCIVRWQLFDRECKHSGNYNDFLLCLSCALDNRGMPDVYSFNSWNNGALRMLKISYCAKHQSDRFCLSRSTDYLGSSRLLLTWHLGVLITDAHVKEVAENPLKLMRKWSIIKQ